ncbi:MAG: DUF4422 domain-containing protein [Lachnospiraceae bacterium]|nr:DUF4422 domain-containing protein [Lachnospiraceae bacterium]
MKRTEVYIATHKQKLAGDSWHIPIQVGAAVNHTDVQNIKDNSGDNISEKNASYCELTALYWIWKNSKADIVGLEHYRRRFSITEEKICQILEGYDMILPKSYLYRISLEEEYKKFHIPEDWDKMRKIILEEYPEYQDAFGEVFGENELIPYNMFIAKKQVCDTYCKWLFPILEKIEQENTNQERDDYQSRYIGFLAERLFTLYVKKNKFHVFICPVEEKEHARLSFQIKNWFGQHIFNPLVFWWRKR